MQLRKLFCGIGRIVKPNFCASSLNLLSMSTTSTTSECVPAATPCPNPINLADFEHHSKSALTQNAYDYYASGANDMITLSENRAAYSRIRLRPRVLIDVSKIDTTTTVLGDQIRSPICVAPAAMQGMAHSDGEVGTAKAAASHGALMVLSTLSNSSLEDVRAAAPSSLQWFQLYVYLDRQITLDLVKRAEAAGYRALVVTVDTPILGRREADVRNKFALPPHLSMGNFLKVGGEHVTTTSVGYEGSRLGSYFTNLIDQSLTWKDIIWLKKNTKLKIVVKGVMTSEDAVEACRAGVDGVWVSNHGGRQLDTACATIEVLEEVVQAVKACGSSSGVPEVYVDGGIMRGTDVFKAIALGARAVFLGRPILWGLAHSGEAGVHKVLQLINDELVLAMKLAGTPSLQDIKRSFVKLP